jgi:hypothetical protein
MKILYYFLPFLAIPAVLLLMSYHTGSPGGKSGSPGDSGNTCTNCHSGTANSITGWITTNVPPSGFAGGQTYTFTATGTHAGVALFGFELTVENAQGQKVGTLQITDPTRTQLTNANHAVTHTDGGITPTGNSNTWSMNWVAPGNVSGQVGIYAAFNAANGNGNNSGDVIYKSSIFISPAPPPAPLLISIVPDIATQGDAVLTTITAENTRFTQESPAVELSFSGDPLETIATSDVTVISDFVVEATFSIPASASAGSWDVHVDELTIEDGFTVELLSGIGTGAMELARIYPNPASRQFFMENSHGAELSILNSKGEILQRSVIGSDKQAIDISQLSTGIYFLRLQAGSMIRTEKLLVK